MKVIASLHTNDSKKAKKLKLMNLHIQTFEQEFKKEAKILRNMNHPHVIKMIHSRMRGGSNNSDDENCSSGRRHKSGESRKSNNSNNSGNGSNSSDENNANENEFDQYIILEYADNGDLFDFTVAF